MNPSEWLYKKKKNLTCPHLLLLEVLNGTDLGNNLAMSCEVYTYKTQRSHS